MGAPEELVTVAEVDACLRERTRVEPSRRSAVWWARVDRLLDRRLALSRPPESPEVRAFRRWLPRFDGPA